jgi:hypothetical protein
VARYFFHLEHTKTLTDREGSEHPDLNAAKRHAVKVVADTLSSEPQTFWDSDVFRVTVSEADGLVLFTVEVVASLSPALDPKS